MDTTKAPRIFYGWWIVLAGFVMYLLMVGLYTYGAGVFYVPLLDTLGASGAALGGVIGLSRLQSGLFAPVVGWLIDRYGPRPLMLIGVAIMGVGFIGLSRITDLWMLYAIFIGMAVGNGFGFAPVNVAVANWFVRKRGRAMGVVFAGMGLGGSMSWALALLVSNLGWRTTAVISGVIFWIVGLPVALLMRHRPEQMGLLPDGVPLAQQDQPTAGSKASANVAGQGPAKEHQQDEHLDIELTPREALKTRAFWMIAVAVGGWSSVTIVSSLYQIPYFTRELHASFVTAAAVASLFPFISIPGRIGFGWLADYVNIRKLMIILYLAQAIGLVIFSRIPSLAWSPLYLIILSPAYGGTFPLRSVIVAHYYGRRNYGTINGLLAFVDLPIVVIAPIFLGGMYDLFGSYRQGILAIAGLIFLGAIALMFATRPRLVEGLEAVQASPPASTTLPL